MAHGEQIAASELEAVVAHFDLIEVGQGLGGCEQLRNGGREALFGRFGCLSLS